VCAENGLRGHLDKYFCDRELFAKLWLSPFLDGEPESTWVAERDGQVVGYLVGAIKPEFERRAVRWIFPHVLRLIGRWMSGRYRHHASTGRFVRWFLTRSWREVPKHAKGSSNFHFSVDQEQRGGERLGDLLLEAYFERLKSVGVQRFHIHVFASSGRREVGFYRRSGFKVEDVKVSSLFKEPTCVVSLWHPVPESVDFARYRVKPPKVWVIADTAVTGLEEQALAADGVITEQETSRVDAGDIVVRIPDATDLTPDALAMVVARCDHGQTRGQVSGLWFDTVGY
jgi:ribosomal protein S18 acetylase RimI-like enzyme